MAPSSLCFGTAKTFGLGGKYGAVSFLQILAPELSDEMLADFLKTESGILVNLHVQAIDQTEAIKTIKRKITDLDAMKIQEQKKAVRSGYDMDIRLRHQRKNPQHDHAGPQAGPVSQRPKAGHARQRQIHELQAEIVSVFLTTADDIFISDPEAEYYPLVKRLHGQVIKLSPTSKDYVNPLDINLNYSEDDSPLALKSDFVLSFCELVMGGKTGLEAIERTVIDRAVKAIYRPYLASPCPENMPILSDLHQALLDQHLPEADRVAQALDLYVSGSLNVFNHKTNVDIHNRLVAFDIKELGKQLKKFGMLIIQDQIWGRVTQNRSQGRATWYFADEFHLLLKEEQTAAYSAEIWKRFRKWGGVPTGATQNVKDLLSSPEIENILENSDFITLLNQASGDRKISFRTAGTLSADQQKYIDTRTGRRTADFWEMWCFRFPTPSRKHTAL